MENEFDRPIDEPPLEFMIVICEHGFTFAVPKGAKLTDTKGYRSLPMEGRATNQAHYCTLYDCEIETPETVLVIIENKKMERNCFNCKFLNLEDSEYHAEDTKWCQNPTVQELHDARLVQIEIAFLNDCKGELFEAQTESAIYESV